MTLELGYRPEDLLVRLTRGGNWWVELVSTEDDGTTPLDYPAGTSIELRFAQGTTITAAVTGNVARLTMSRTAVTALIAAFPATGRREVSLWYLDGTGIEIPWGEGTVSVGG